jgi:hypothetical protein
MGEDIKKEVSAIRPFASVGLNVWLRTASKLELTLFTNIFHY